MNPIWLIVGGITFFIVLYEYCRWLKSLWINKEDGGY